MSGAQERRAEERVAMLREEEWTAGKVVSDLEQKALSNPSPELAEKIKQAKHELGVASAQLMRAMESRSY